MRAFPLLNFQTYWKDTIIKSVVLTSKATDRIIEKDIRGKDKCYFLTNIHLGERSIFSINVTEIITEIFERK